MDDTRRFNILVEFLNQMIQAGDPETDLRPEHIVLMNTLQFHALPSPDQVREAIDKAMPAEDEQAPAAPDDVLLDVLRPDVTITPPKSNQENNN